MKFYLVVVCFIVVAVQTSFAQLDNFGLRAGLNYSKFLGPTLNQNLAKESFDFNSGIHFGITYTYDFTDVFGLSTEIAYNQIGSKYTYEGNSYFIFQYQNSRLPLKGHAKRIFEINNSYVSIPLLASFKPHRKIEIQAGVYGQFLVISKGVSKLTFTSPDEDNNPYSFIQSTDANYYSDKPQGFQSSREIIRVCLEKEHPDDQTCPDDKIITMPRIVGGYYEYDASELAGSMYKWFDAGLQGSFSYFFNSSLYLRLTCQYGLLDVSNNKVDRDYSKLSETNRFIYQQDWDKNFNLGLSIGFKF